MAVWACQCCNPILNLCVMERGGVFTVLLVLVLFHLQTQQIQTTPPFVFGAVSARVFAGPKTPPTPQSVGSVAAPAPLLLRRPTAGTTRRYSPLLGQTGKDNKQGRQLRTRHINSGAFQPGSKSRRSAMQVCLRSKRAGPRSVTAGGPAGGTSETGQMR